jgi:hypothetical protein
MDSRLETSAPVDGVASRAAANALVHEYSRRYIADSPHRMGQLLEAYRTKTEAAAEADDAVDERS